MDELIQRIDGHFQDMHVSQRQSIREIEGLKEVVGDTQAHVTGLQSNMSSLQSNMSSMQSNMSSMQESITKVQSDMVRVKSDIAHLQIDMRRMHVRVDGLQVSMINTNTAIVELRGTFASLGVMLKEHARRISDLEDKQAS